MLKPVLLSVLCNYRERKANSTWHIYSIQYKCIVRAVRAILTVGPFDSHVFIPLIQIKNISPSPRCLGL